MTNFGVIESITKAGSLRVKRLAIKVISDEGNGTSSTLRYKILLDDFGQPVTNGIVETYISRNGGWPKKGDTHVDGIAILRLIKDVVWEYNKYY